MTFRITGLDRAHFAHLFALSNAALAGHGVQRLTVEHPNAAPCRIGLRDLDPGETVLLLNHEHHPADTPYRSRHAIFVGEQSATAETAPGEVPDVLRRRPLSIRAFDAAGMMTDADLVDGAEAAGLIARMLADARVDHLDIHYARRGCWAARVRRA